MWNLEAIRLTAAVQGKRGEAGPGNNEANESISNRAPLLKSAIQLDQRVESRGLDRVPRAELSTTSAANPEWKSDRVLTIVMRIGNVWH
jgi:hypothetical protein